MAIENKIVQAKKLLKIVGYNRISKAKMFEKLRIGDIIEIAYDIPIKSNTYTSRNEIRIKNIKTNEIVFKSQYQLGNILDAFELEEVE